MLSLLFTICMIGFVGKFFIFGLRASWGILKLLTGHLNRNDARRTNPHRISIITDRRRDRTCSITFLKIRRTNI